MSKIKVRRKVLSNGEENLHTIALIIADALVIALSTYLFLVGILVTVIVAAIILTVTIIVNIAEILG